MATVTDVEELEVLGSYVTFPASFHDSPVIASACSLLLDVSYMLHQITPTCEPVYVLYCLLVSGFKLGPNNRCFAERTTPSLDAKCATRSEETTSTRSRLQRRSVR